MKYKKIINLLDNTPHQPAKFKTKNWVEMNYDSRGVYNTNSHTEFKTVMLKLSFCYHCDAYILVKATVSIVPVPPPVANPNDSNEELVSRNYALLIDCMSEITNIQDNDVVIPRYSSTEYSNNYSKTSESLWQHYTDGPFLDANSNIADFPAANINITSIIIKQKIAGKAVAGRTKNVQIILLLKQLSKF